MAQTAEHDIDAVAAPVPALVIFDGLVARFSTWNAGLDRTFTSAWAKEALERFARRKS